jgi:hypothetical protein
MIEVDITKEMISKASELSKRLGSLKHSIRNGQGNIAGFLGEECVLRAFPKAQRDNDYNHDLILDNKRLEVKTKDRTVVPRQYYECSVPAYNTFQDTDYYVFVSLLRKGDDYVKGYIVGYMRKSEYYRKARHLKRGELDTSNNFIVKADCWNLQISELHTWK